MAPKKEKAPPPSSKPAKSGGGKQKKKGDNSFLDVLSGDPYITGLDNDVALNCLARVDDMHSLSILNTRFNQLIKTGYLRQLRKQMLGIVDHHGLYILFRSGFTYYDRQLERAINIDTSYWDIIDPVTRTVTRLPKIPLDPTLSWSLRNEIVVGNEFLVFGTLDSDTCFLWKYNVVSQKWDHCKEPALDYRCFLQDHASCSYGSIAIIAGGVSKAGNILNSAELYDSLTGKWERLPNMHTERQRCAAFFMDGKFYVIGGLSGTHRQVFLTCGEEFDMKTGKWRKIEGMYKNMKHDKMLKEPLVAVVDNKLYGIILATGIVAKYDKELNTWFVLGRVPVHPIGKKWYFISLRAWGDKLVVTEKGEREGRHSVLVRACCPNSGVTTTNGNVLDWQVLGIWFEEEPVKMFPLDLSLRK